ncbi:MAG: UbiA prenyltransferase family protein [Kiritimatiellae bacterium]|nr:UbiA prenyltransferase family protein [Kiritimatiellia bacterium]
MIEKAVIWIRALRVEQWTKNGVVMVAWFFSVADSSQREIVRGWESFLMAFAMAGAFSLISSAFYLLNDVSDYDADRLHPVKCNRPIAAGRIAKITAVRVALVLFATGFAYPALVVIFLPSRTVAFATVLAYTVMQCFYTGFLKRIPYIDVATLAAGFVLRAIAGAAIIAAYISPWLLVCTFSLAMFLALCKRKNEMDTAIESREVLRRYHPNALAALIVVAGIASFGEYLAYTLTSKMGERFPFLWVTSSFVLLGIVRYAVLTWRKGDVGRPEKVLLTDRPLWCVLIGYAISAVLAVAIGVADKIGA